MTEIIDGVDGKGDGIVERLVDAKSKPAAHYHVFGEPRSSVRIATVDDLKRLLPTGVKIETAAE